MNKRVLGVLSVALLGISSTAGAGTFDFGAVPNPQDAVKALTEDLSSALSYKAISPPEALGITGFDIGAEASFTNIEGIKTWGSTFGIPTDLAYLPVPKLHAHKGLPFGLDIGAVYMPAVKGLSYWGGELRYAILGGNVALPAIGIRGAYTQLTGVQGYDFNTKSLEIGISKGFLMLKPYAGVGMVWGNGTPKGDAASLLGLKEQSVSQIKYNVGLNLNMGLVNFAFDWDQTGKDNTYSAKMGFRW